MVKTPTQWQKWWIWEFCSCRTFNVNVTGISSLPTIPPQTCIFSLSSSRRKHKSPEVSPWLRNNEFTSSEVCREISFFRHRKNRRNLSDEVETLMCHYLFIYMCYASRDSIYIWVTALDLRWCLAKAELIKGSSLISELLLWLYISSVSMHWFKCALWIIAGKMED